MAHKAKLFIISAPSGAGKTTLIRQVLKRWPALVYSISHTTRPPRRGEVHGRDYFFIDKSKFREMIDQDQWLEWACVHGNFYGTSRSFIMDNLEADRSVLLDIDVQGAEKIMASGLDVVSIFIMPPSLTVLCQRLENQGNRCPGG